MRIQTLKFATVGTAIASNRSARAEHKQVKVSVGDWVAEVDVRIADLIRELWRADIDTCLSCQENPPGFVWLEFFTPDDASRFLEIVARYEDGADTMYDRISGRWDDASNWKYAICPFDHALIETIEDGGDGEDVISETHEGPPIFDFNVSVRFPQADYASVLDRLRAWNSVAEPVRRTLALGVLNPRESANLR